MGFFTRRSKGSTDDAGSTPDDALPFWSRADADRFRAVVGSVLVDLGSPATIHPDHAVDAQGRQFGFWNVAALCAERRPREWRGLVEAHLRRILESMDAPDPFEGLDRDEAHVRTYARVYEEGALPPDRADRYPSRELAPGIVEMLALDLPETVVVYDHANARALGGYAALRESGLANLDQLPVEHVETVQAPGGGAFHALLGESVYTGSRALRLPGLATAVTGEQPTAAGWLMSVPNRHQVTWHVVRDASVIPVVGAMANFTRLGFSDSPGPVSPHVYWWSGTEYEQLTHVDDDGTVSVLPSPRFQAMLEVLLGTG